ncbi:uroporphyrinogen-III synthase [Nesterenkonia flava]|uniref:Uroporphyrinogen-III synthase n=1 Tax=Nesterenkonia flava TaxID=469799 RepID=A0ABU1FU02_9MICC|nr:uroporphyrinogen-III synthase [Nesterenkonia flava]MDR5712126.1 uroporphyrinogen-III synthase [Nesterenkonia flava]
MNPSLPASSGAPSQEAIPEVPSTGSPEPVPAPSLPQTLSGFRIGVTADRRSEELISAFQRRGAEVIHAPALRIASLTESITLQHDTNKVIASAPDYAIITTAYGMRRWAEAADSYGVWNELYEALEGASILVRGPKARGAVRASGLDDDGAAEDERTETVLDMLLENDLRGKTVAFQLHGLLNHDQISRLERAGATVVTVMPYTWTKPPEDSELLKMIDAVIERQLDMVTFTAAPAVDAFLGVAQQYGKRAALLEALQTDVLTAAVGGVTAAPLTDAGIEAVVPDRWRLGAMIKKVCDHLENHHTIRLETQYGPVELRGAQLRTPELSADPVRLAPGPLALMRTLMEAGGQTLSREALLEQVRYCDSGHALEMWVSRLRKVLPVSDLVQTVVKRGYRIKT